MSSVSMSSRRMVRSQILKPPSHAGRYWGLFRHCSMGFSGAPNSRLKKLVGSVPSSGRPICEITLFTSGIEAITSRSRGARVAANSRDVVRGTTARIQR